MRVNVYGEELTDRIELIEKEVVEESTGKTFSFYGVRLWLKFPNQPWWIHRKTISGEDDDDSSAVTIWAETKDELAGVFKDCLLALKLDEEYTVGLIEEELQEN